MNWGYVLIRGACVLLCQSKQAHGLRVLNGPSFPRVYVEPSERVMAGTRMDRLPSKTQGITTDRESGGC